MACVHRVRVTVAIAVDMAGRSAVELSYLHGQVVRSVFPLATRRAMKSVVRGFLGTYASRNSDYRGYWMHGQLPPDLLHCTIDLLGLVPLQTGITEAVCHLAVRRFAEQLHRGGLTLDLVREATLQIASTGELVRGWQGDFVAPHDPEKERRRREADWGA